MGGEELAQRRGRINTLLPVPAAVVASGLASSSTFVEKQGRVIIRAPHLGRSGRACRKASSSVGDVKGTFVDLHRRATFVECLSDVNLAEVLLSPDEEHL